MNARILDNLYLATVSYQFLNIYKTFAKDFGSNIKECWFWYCVRKCVNIQKSCETQGANVFQMTNWCF